MSNKYTKDFIKFDLSESNVIVIFRKLWREMGYIFIIKFSFVDI
jgi:hypothetical protein